MAKLNVSKLDFQDIKQSLREFLSSQDKFKDYNWEGSNLSVLLDLLAYNTQIMAFYANMSISESFLDSSVLRNSAVSIAKTLGYIPRSKKSAVAYVDLELFPLPNNLGEYPATLQVQRYTKFDTVLSNYNYTFTNLEPRTVYRDENGDYILKSLQLTEGDVLTYQWNITSTPQRFVIPNADVDIGTIYVEVQESDGSSIKEVFSPVVDVNELDFDSPNYFLQCNENGLYEIYFGDNILGKKPSVGNIVKITYLLSHAEEANGASIFRDTGGVAGTTNPTITTVETAANGQDAESIESIKFYAPKTYEVQNRAVTKTDYETLIMHDFPYLDAIRVWGGEDNIPPKYGFVFICPKPKTGVILTERMKNYLREVIIQNRNVVGIQTELVDPEYLKIVIDSEVTFKNARTTKRESEIEAAVITAISSFAENNLVNFDSIFRYSKLVKAIDEADDSVLNNFTTVKLKAPLKPVFQSPRRYEIKYNNAIDKGDVLHGIPALSSDPFYYDDIIHYLEDDGNGNIYSYRFVENRKVKTQNNIGSIDYALGIIVLSAFAPDAAFTPQGDTIHLIVTPAKNDVLSLRNQILRIEPEDIHITLVNESV